MIFFTADTRLLRLNDFLFFANVDNVNLFKVKLAMTAMYMRTPPICDLPSHCHTITLSLSHCHTITLSHCHLYLICPLTVTPSHCHCHTATHHTVTLSSVPDLPSHYHTVTLSSVPDLPSIQILKYCERSQISRKVSMYGRETGSSECCSYY